MTSSQGLVSVFQSPFVCAVWGANTCVGCTRSYAEMKELTRGCGCRRSGLRSQDKGHSSLISLFRDCLFTDLNSHGCNMIRED